MAEIINKSDNLDWDLLIQDYHASGLSAAKWSQKHGIKVHKLRWQISKRQKTNKEQSVQWVSLQSNPTVPAKIIIVKIGNAEILVSEGFNKELFSEVASTLITLC